MLLNSDTRMNAGRGPRWQTFHVMRNKAFKCSAIGHIGYLHLLPSLAMIHEPQGTTPGLHLLRKLKILINAAST